MRGLLSIAREGRARNCEVPRSASELPSESEARGGDWRPCLCFRGHSQEWLCYRVRMALRGAGGRRWEWLGAQAAGALGLLKNRIAEIGWCIYRKVPTRSNQLERLWKTRKIHRAMR